MTSGWQRSVTVVCPQHCTHACCGRPLPLRMRHVDIVLCLQNVHVPLSAMAPVTSTLTPPACRVQQVQCFTCLGAGRLNSPGAAVPPKGEGVEWCPHCRGTGREVCPWCMGEGFKRDIGFRV